MLEAASAFAVAMGAGAAVAGGLAVGSSDDEQAKELTGVKAVAPSKSFMFMSPIECPFWPTDE